MKANNLQIAVILLVVLAIGLIVALVLMNQGNDKRIAETVDAKKRAETAEKKERDLMQQLITLKQLLGHEAEADPGVIQKAHQDIMEKEKITADASRNYLFVVKKLEAEIDKKNEEHKKLNEEYLKLQADYNNLETLNNTVKEDIKKTREDAVKRLAAAQAGFSDTIAKQKEEADVIIADKKKFEDEAQAQIKEAVAKAENSDIEAKQIKLRNNELVGVIDDLRRTNFDRPNGKILSVSQQSGTVIVNLGSEDGLMTRMTFSVYAPSITGISFGNADPDHEAVICEVCKRERSLNASKASIEVIRIIGPHKAEGRILDDQLTDPIVAGDVVYTPIWKPGQHQHFALASGMRIAGIGSRDGKKQQNDLLEVIRLIEANGGIVDSYISNGEDKDHKRGERVGKITRDTTFLVIGDLDDEDNNDQTTMKSQTEMIEDAEQFAVKKINLRELLSRMGWKNVTPVRGFGKAVTDSDIGIVPTGDHRISTGLVAPIYQKRNDTARISVNDRSSRVSNGAVSGLYSNTPPGNPSNGQTSELFRPRKPASSADELAP